MLCDGEDEEIVLCDDSSRISYDMKIFRCSFLADL